MTDIDHYESAVQSMFRAAIKRDDLTADDEMADALVSALLAIADRLPLAESQALAGLRDDLDSLRTRMARLESMAAHPAWCVPLTEDEEGEKTAGNCEVAPGSPDGPFPALVDLEPIWLMARCRRNVEYGPEWDAWATVAKALESLLARRS